MKSPTTQLITALVLLTVVGFGFRNWYGFVAAESARAVAIQKQIDTRKQSALRLSSAREALGELADSETEINDHFVSPASIVVFVNSLETEGTMLGTKMAVLSVSPGADTRPAFLVTLSAQGTFDAVMRTVGAIESSSYDLSLSSLTVRQEAPNLWNANISLTVGSLTAASSTSSTATLQ